MDIITVSSETWLYQVTQWAPTPSNKPKHNTNILCLEWPPMPSLDKTMHIKTKSVWHTTQKVVVFNKTEAAKQEEGLWMTGRQSLCKSTLLTGRPNGVSDSNSWDRLLCRSRCATKCYTSWYLWSTKTMWWSYWMLDGWVIVDALYLNIVS